MKLSVVVPTVNSIEEVKTCISSLQKQSIECEIIVVANGTTDGTQRYLALEHPDVFVISDLKPLGFAGAVNKGISHALSEKSDYIALLNNDAVADRKWLEYLKATMDNNPDAGIVTGKILHGDTRRFDSTGDYYTNWLLPYPRGRDVRDRGQYDNPEQVVSASGGASLYRSEIFKKVGLFDEDFFAYYEDVDISLRTRHAGWNILYEPRAIVQHAIGSTSNRIKGFTTLQTMKNLPLLAVKNVPIRVLAKNFPRFNLAYTLFFGRALMRHHGYYAIKGWLAMVVLLPKKLKERRQILKLSHLSSGQFENLLVKDLPPNARALRKIRKLVKR